MSNFRIAHAAPASDQAKRWSQAASHDGRFARRAILCVSALPVVVLGGCALTPPGADEQHAQLQDQAPRFEQRFERRNLPDLSSQPSWQEILHRAFLANGELEAAYFEWKAAYERIGIASAYPNTNVALGYSYTFSSASMKTFDRMTFSAGFDGMENLSWPNKVRQQGKVALDEARSAGERFRAAKFQLQERVLSAWADYALLAERVRIAQENLNLLQIALDAATARVQAGGMQEDLLRAQVECRTAEDALHNDETQLDMQRAALNSMLARDIQASLAPPERLGAPRLIPDDATLLAAAGESNPELAALARQVEGRSDALELARLQWIPDINPSIAFNGGAAQMLGAVIVLPTTIAEIQGRIKQAQSLLRASEATLRQSTYERGAAFVAALISLRNAERQQQLFEQRVLPATTRLVDNLRSAYASGDVRIADVIDAQRALLDVRLTIAEARTLREQRLAEIERLAGVDVETLVPSSFNETEQPPSAAQIQALGAQTKEVARHD